MVDICFYFQVHQPFRLRRYRVFDIGRSTDYFDEAADRTIMRKVAAKCYLPMNALLHELIERPAGGDDPGQDPGAPRPVSRSLCGGIRKPA